MNARPDPARAVKNKAKRTIFAILVFGFLSLLCGYTAKEYIDQQVNRDLPAFNPEKAQTLTPEQRQRYDILMFNQFSVVGQGDTEKRYQLFKKMAEDGFEPAYLLLRLHSVRGNYPLNDPVALKRAKELGDQGDRSALCLWVLVHRDKEGRFDIETVEPWLKKASELNHPKCMSLYAGLAFFEGQFGGEAKANAIPLILDAAKQGDLKAQLNLVILYSFDDWGKKNWPLAKCWMSEAFKSDTDEARVMNTLLHSQAIDELGKGAYAMLPSYKEGSHCTELNLNPNGEK
jgi:TPR repeat protein